MSIHINGLFTNPAFFQCDLAGTVAHLIKGAKEPQYWQRSQVTAFWVLNIFVLILLYKTQEKVMCIALFLFVCICDFKLQIELIVADKDGHYTNRWPLNT